eukprot:s7463_g3.t3
MLTVVGWRLARYEDLLRSMETLHQTLLRGRDKMPAPIRWLRHRGWTDYRQLEGLRHDGKPLSEMLETEAMLDVQSFPAMMMPDYALIGEIMFYAYGFTEAKILAKKMARAS